DPLHLLRCLDQPDVTGQHLGDQGLIVALENRDPGDDVGRAAPGCERRLLHRRGVAPKAELRAVNAAERGKANVIVEAPTSRTAMAVAIVFLTALCKWFHSARPPMGLGGRSLGLNHSGDWPHCFRYLRIHSFERRADRTRTDGAVHFRMRKGRRCAVCATPAPLP